MARVTLLDLPNELLLQIPEHMRNLEDFMHASSSCHRLQSVFAQTQPKTILRLACRSAPTFFSPEPHFLALATARQVAQWTLAEPDNRTKQLIEAFRGGVQGLLLLALRDDVVGVGLSMADVRRVCAQRFSVINPLNKTIDAMIGSEWYRTPDFWNGGVDDAFTLYADVDNATMELLLYGELFGSTMDSFLAPSASLPRLSNDTRIEFIKYCIPDWSCTPNHRREDGFEVLPVGPWAPKTINKGSAALDDMLGNQTALAHLLGGAMFEGSLWKRAWRRVLVAAGCLDDPAGAWPDAWKKVIRKMDPKREELERAKAKYVTSPNAEDHQVDADAGNVDGIRSSDEGGRGPEDIAHDGTRGGGIESEGERQGGEEVGRTNEEQEHDEDDEYNAEKYDLWRFKLFWDTLTQLGGLEGMEMVAQFKGQEEHRNVVMKPEWRSRILHIRDQVLALEETDFPKSKNLGKRQRVLVSEAPDIRRELYVCCAGLWSDGL